MSDLLPLKCPRCGKGLEGENNSKVFFCRPCALGLNWHAGAFEAYPLLYVQPTREVRGPSMYFPFWLIESRYDVTQRTAYERRSGQRISYVPAFFIRHINNFGDIGFYYTGRSIGFETGPDRSLPLFPADRNLQNALALPLVYFWKLLSLECDIETLDVRLEHERFSLLLIPYEQSGSDWIDPLISWRYPSGALI